MTQQAPKFTLIIPILLVVLVLPFAVGSCGGNGGLVQKIAGSAEFQAAKKEVAERVAAASVQHETDDRTMTSSSANDVKPEEKVVYLTFDDGPSGQTEQILDILDSYGVKATWFIAGGSGKDDLIKTIWDRGHQIAIHTNSHQYRQIYSSPQAFFEDMDAMGARIEDQIGSVPTIMRFPGGSYNSYDAAVLPDIKAELENRKWHYFDWNVSSGDASSNTPDVDFILANITSESDGKNSCCVLMHDTDAKVTTTEALPDIIKYYLDNGYKFDYLKADSFGYHF